ncbi:inositol polyphosphate 5-phosphatase OCRL isoform X1 [Diorhabda carinulata]|uniref:inositol polyphosphate 5-phosphatase OCRL isoform X1 n=2 Tax=Diorhabda carinulata TaxID=1163345 RepID=UPI0025A06000|nr:inositol polyphosphate 5-phosphatase OCRL isoform X1 [Diorhabda carinulata]XP_057654456.1 inositol polyphosphate 5-phosphatase OCRL isoform X1 [Diorhabda carinulata]
MLAVHRDVVNIVQAKFLSAEVVKSIHLNVYTLDEIWSNENRILALVEYNKSFALFVLISSKIKPTSISDLSIETVTPIDEFFSCDTEPIEDSQNHIIFIITYKKIRRAFKIEIGVESSNFASEVIRSKELSLYNKPIFVWLDKYLGTMSQSSRHIDIDQDDIPVTRQKIAQGQTSINRESMFKYQLKLKEPEFTQKQEFTIFVGTWNVNGQPPSVSLKNWLSCDEDPPDLYAIGFQEIDLSKEAFLFNDTPREAEWHKFVTDGVHPKAKYKLVGLTRLVGMQLIVMVNSQHYHYVRNISVDTVGTGLLGKMGNKGGVGVRLELHNTSLCFVNCHLAAHVEEYERRNQDYKDINARMNFKRSPQAIKDHEQIYWLGDLNYRITDLTTSQVKTLLTRNEMPDLLKVDQLNQQKEKGNVLLDYQEGDITFPPTYKYDLNTDTFDTSEKARPPAWTDRILWRGRGIYQVKYRSHMDLRISDHKPVSALFKSEISVVDPLKYRKIHEELLKKMDKYENEYLPQVTVEPTEIVYDLIKFRETQSRETTIANTGMVPAEFEFIKKLDENSYCKNWLRIIPYSGSINPGEKCDVKLEVSLETDLPKIYDILVLHLKGGKDIFITVSGDCQKSSFTASISSLCRIPIPIMQVPAEQWILAEKGESAVLYSVPRELWFLIDHIYRHGMKTKELFESSALHEEIIRIRDWLDFGSLDPFPGSVQAAAETLLLFLSYTKDPVIPHELHDNCIAAASNYQNCKQIILQKVPDLHRNVFLYVCMFLQDFLKYHNDNGYDAKTLASLFGDILLRDQIRNSKPQASRGKSNFVYNFLVNDLSSSIAPPK